MSSSGACGDSPPIDFAYFSCIVQLGNLFKVACLICSLFTHCWKKKTLKLVHRSLLIIKKYGRLTLAGNPHMRPITFFLACNRATRVKVGKMNLYKYSTSRSLKSGESPHAPYGVKQPYALHGRLSKTKIMSKIDNLANIKLDEVEIEKVEE